MPLYIAYNLETRALASPLAASKTLGSGIFRSRNRDA